MRLIFLLLLLPVAAFAQDMGFLTELKGRYVIGPWTGSQQGTSCVLGNDEPLAGAGLLLSGTQGSTEIQASLNGKPVTLDFAALEKEPFLDVEAYVFDLHGFSRAFALLKQCLASRLPENLPDEPLAEGEAGTVGNWQVISLTMGAHVYARLATLNDTRPVSLSLWRYGPGRLVLSISSLHGLAPQAEPFEAILNDNMKLPFWLQ
jgi:hypothetical protein